MNIIDYKTTLKIRVEQWKLQDKKLLTNIYTHVWEWYTRYLNLLDIKNYIKMIEWNEKNNMQN